MDVVNRAMLLLLDDSGEVRRLHRLFVALDGLADQGTDVPAGHLTLDPPGLGHLVTTIGSRTRPVGHRSRRPAEGAPQSARHVAGCATKSDTNAGPLQTLVHLHVTSPGIPGYWREIELRNDAKLEALDSFAISGSNAAA